MPYTGLRATDLCQKHASCADTCEKCHNPDKFSNDTVKQIKNYVNDEENTENRTILTLKTGGGSECEGLGKGIDGHIENEVWFYLDDKLKQDIPYVKEVSTDGAAPSSRSRN